mmetsp:Transcript_94798/g.216927  ORF Transcript_94798/g.216927 Transcript_94798/m.216927 type:complete len:336 (-) Transcript_94798:81-1088(-)
MTSSLLTRGGNWRRRSKLFLSDKANNRIEVSSVRKVHESFEVFFKLYHQMKSQVADRPAMPQAHGEGEEVAADGTGHRGSATGVGDEEAGHGFSVGLAAAGARPPVEGIDGDDVPADGQSAAEPRRDASDSRVEDSRAPDRQLAFLEFKEKEGKQFEEAFQQNKEDLKAKKLELKDVLSRVNLQKKEIDRCREALELKQMERSGAEESDVIDEEEYALIQRLKSEKSEYRLAFDNHQQIKKDIMQIEHMIMQCKTELVNAFSEWYNKRFGHLEGGDGTVSFDASGNQDLADDVEQFEMMAAEQMDRQHPDALAYYKAVKATNRTIRQKASQPKRR